MTELMTGHNNGLSFFISVVKTHINFVLQLSFAVLE